METSLTGRILPVGAATAKDKLSIARQDWFVMDIAQDACNRRQFLCAAGAAGCSLAAGSAVFALPPGDEKLILSAPLTHSDWMLKPGIPWGVDGVRHMLDVCKSFGLSRIYWRVLDGGRAMYRSKIVRAEGKWDGDNFWNPKSDGDRQLSERFSGGVSSEKRKQIIDKFQSLDYAHFDTFAAAVEYGHQIGLQIHAWVSINEDDHGWGLTSDFARAHPQYRWVRRDGRPYHSQMSFAFAEVREYKLQIIRELLQGYPLDGIFLDWIRTGDVRDNPQTDGDGVANSGYETPLVEEFKKRFGVDPHQVPNNDPRWVQMRAEPQTSFMRECRKLLDSQSRKIPLAVMVAHPWHYRGMQDKIDGSLNGLLLDVKTWASEHLIDAAVAAGYYRAGGNASLAWKSLFEITSGQVDVWTYAWVPQNVADFATALAIARQLGARQILFWEADYFDDRSDASGLKAAMTRQDKA